MNRLVLAFLVCLTALQVSGQTGTIRGRVLDAKTLEPLPFANVFLNNTTIGTVTDLNGDFALTNIGYPAVYEVIFSFVGYESYKTKVSMSEAELRAGVIKLKDSGIELSVVEVKGKKDVVWEKKLKRFKKIFFGDDKAADQCEIVNPWVIDFPIEKDIDKFAAIASAPIEIENKFLGYKIYYYLGHFSATLTTYLIKGNFRFEELKEVNDEQRVTWQRNRQKSYLRSRQHLFKAILDGRIKGEGFNLYNEMVGVDATKRSEVFASELGQTLKHFDTARLVSPDKKDLYRISLKGRVEVHFRGEKPRIRTYRDVFYMVSWIELKNGFVIVNKDGIEMNPGDVLVSGAMNDDRVAELLPTNYVPHPREKSIEEQRIELLPFIQEQIYVNTDKPYYYPGEAIWFKGSINYGSPSMRDSLSQTVHVEFVDRANKSVMMTSTCMIDSGFFTGRLRLADTLKANTYYLRAYSNLNRNFGDENLTVIPIPVFGISEKVNEHEGHMATQTDSTLLITSDKPDYKVRQKILLNLLVKDDEGQPLVSNISVSVTDIKQVVPLAPVRTILDAFPLKDILMKDVKKDLPFGVEYGITFKGRFLNDTNKPEQAMLGVLRTNPKGYFMAQSDANGFFVVNGPAFYDTAIYCIQGIGEKGKNYGKAEILKADAPDMNFERSSRKIVTNKTESPQRIISEYELPKETTLLNEIVVRSTRDIEEHELEYKVKRPYGKPDYVLQAKDINTSYGNLLYAIQGKFPGLQVRQVTNRGEETRWAVYLQRMISINNPAEVIVTINDAFVGGTPEQVLATIDPFSVATIELKTGVNVLYGGNGGNGILAIYTKKGISEPTGPIANVPSVKVFGYARPQKFKAPDYSDPKTDPNTADYRSTIYWNPDVRTGKDGKATVSFSAADLGTTYQVIAEGVTANGKPVRAVYYFEVKAQ